MPDLDQLLRPDISLAASQAAQPVDFAAIEHRAAQRRRTQTVLALTATAAAVVLALVGGLQVARSQGASPTITVDQPTPTPTRGWTGPVRPGLASLPRVPAADWRDGADTAAAEVDILTLAAGGSRRLSWNVALRGTPPLANRGQPNARAVEYGLVVDGNGDRVPDCEIGINDNAQGPQGFRVWVKNLRTGQVEGATGGPYGWPFDFKHPEESPQDPYTNHRVMSFFFLTDFPWKVAPGAFPCDPFKRAAAYYAWAVTTEDGTPVAWDFAPDAAWLRMPVAGT